MLKSPQALVEGSHTMVGLYAMQALGFLISSSSMR